MDPECGASGTGKTGYFKMLASGFDDEEDLLFSDSEFSVSDEDSDVSDDEEFQVDVMNLLTTLTMILTSH